MLRLMVIEGGEGSSRVENVHAGGAATAIQPIAPVPARAADDVGPKTVAVVMSMSGGTGVPVRVIARLGVLAVASALVASVLLALAAGHLQILGHGFEAGLLLLVLVLQLADNLHLDANL